MTSNSDTIYQVLLYIRRHPDKITIQQNELDNAIIIFIDDNVKLGNMELYFPNEKLDVNRMSDDFLTQNYEIIDYFHNKTIDKDLPFHELWVTTSHIASKKKYMIDLSFEQDV